MANQVLVTQGTTITWTSSGGDETLTLTSLADGDGRAGDEHDFGADFPARARFEIVLDFNTAPTENAGNTVDCYWSSSQDGTNYDGECSGADEAFNSEATAGRLHWVGSLQVSNDTDPQRTSFVFTMPARYGLPVVMNQSGVALTATGTDQIVKITPLIDEIQDAA